MDDARAVSLERAGFGALVALLLAPVVAHGLWRPLVHVFGSVGSAGVVTAAALWVSAVTVLAYRTRLVRRARPLLILGVLVVLAASAWLALGVAGLLSLFGVAGATGWLLPWLSSRLPVEFDGLFARHRVLTALYVLLALASVFSIARLSVFIGDPSRADMQMLPGDRFVETHSWTLAEKLPEGTRRPRRGWWTAIVQSVEHRCRSVPSL